jgi:hypothetical protein
MVNLLDSVHEHLTPAFIHETAHWLGEKENNTAKALGAWSAAILAGTMNYADHTKAINRIYNHLGQFPPHIMENPEALLRKGNLSENDPKDVSGHLMGQLFGAKTTPLINAIAAFSGARPEAVSELLGVAAPLVLSIMGKRVQTGALSVAGLSNLLRSDQDRILAALPSGLGTILGVYETAPAANNEPAVATGTQWVWALALLAAVGLGLLWAFRWYTGKAGI